MITDYNLQILIEPLLKWFAGHARVLYEASAGCGGFGGMPGG